MKSLAFERSLASSARRSASRASAWSVSRLTTATVASWTSRLDEDGPSALVQIREPVNQFPLFVRYLVQRLKIPCPAMATARIADVLCRAGRFFGRTTVRRMMKEPTEPLPEMIAVSAAARRLRSKRPNHI